MRETDKNIAVSKHFIIKESFIGLLYPALLFFQFIKMFHDSVGPTLLKQDN